jgi:hypothetical protein
MGNTSVSQQESSSLSAINNVLQDATSTCTLSCQSSLSNITIVISGSTVGNITIADTCAITGSQCLISTSLDTNITNILTSIFNQTAVTARSLIDCLGDDNVNQSIKIEEAVTNNITQLINSTCNMTVNTSVSDVTFVAKDGATVGNFSVVSAGNITKSNCSLQNIAQAVITNNLTAKGSQTAITGVAAVMGMFMFIIIIVIVIIVLCFIVLKGGSGIGGGITKKIVMSALKK